MPKGNVLVVEDDDTIRRLLIEVFKQHAFLCVDGARDGIEALHQLSLTPYKVIVLDLMMPKMSGVDFLDSLEAMSNDPSVKSLQSHPSVIVITAAPAADVPNAAIEHRSGLVRGVFRKPLDVSRLAEQVERQLRA